jgi:hypothetical protein
MTWWVEGSGEWFGKDLELRGVRGLSAASNLIWVQLIWDYNLELLRMFGCTQGRKGINRLNISTILYSLFDVLLRSFSQGDHFRIATVERSIAQVNLVKTSDSPYRIYTPSSRMRTQNEGTSKCHSHPLGHLTNWTYRFRWYSIHRIDNIPQAIGDIHTVFVIPSYRNHRPLRNTT